MDYKSLLPDFMSPVIEQIIKRGNPVSKDLTPIYRATKNKDELEQKDFKSQIEDERGDSTKPGNYSCSVNYEENGRINLASKLDTIRGLAKNNPYVAIGLMKVGSGLIEIDDNNHVNWWIFQGEKGEIPKYFKHYKDVKSFIEEKEEKNEYK